jgi:hypothetical protein
MNEQMHIESAIETTYYIYIAKHKIFIYLENNKSKHFSLKFHKNQIQFYLVLK